MLYHCTIHGDVLDNLMKCNAFVAAFMEEHVNDGCSCKDGEITTLDIDVSPSDPFRYALNVMKAHSGIEVIPSPV